MRRHIRNDRGMTLVELLTVLLVFSLVSGAVFSVLLTSLRAYWKGDIATQVQQGGRLSLDRLTRDLRQARASNLLNSVSAGGFTFNTACTPNPQISVKQPHLGLVTLSDGVTQIYATDATPCGTMPCDGYYVSYYLSATQGSTTPNAVGPYLEKTVWSIVGASLTTVSVAGNVTALTLVDRATGLCPTAASQEVTVQITASQTGPNVSSTDVITSDVKLRN